MAFTHLHVHSHYSLLTGLATIKALVKDAKKKGFSAIALTDYATMYGAIEFYETCLKEEIKPIIGFEAYVAAGRRDDDNPAYFHLTLLAENYHGYRNLIELSSAGCLEGNKHGKPRIDKELLQKYKDGVIVLSGTIAGEIPQLLRADKYEEAKKVALWYKELLGAEYFFLELQDHPAIPGQIDVNTKLIQLGEDVGLECVVTRDVHYLNPDDTHAQDVLTCIRDGHKVADPNRVDYRQVDRSLNTEADITSRFRHIQKAIENTQTIADRINIVIELNKWHFAPIDLPPGKNADEALADFAYTLAPTKYNPVTDEIKERIAYELDIIKTKGYSPYFICVADYVKYAKSNGIVETTRGSAAGSVVSYVMGITTVDPIRFKLPFERFLNPFRPSPPDIDTDFADDRRDDMIKYVTDKYGADRVAQIITFGTMAARASVRDVGRALGLGYGFCDQVAKLIPQGAQGFPMTIERALKEEPDLKKLYDSNEDVKRLLDLAQKVEGCARHTSIHAAGVVISPTKLTDFTPVQYETGGTRLTTQYEMHAVEAAGVLKMDFLGIRNLSILGKAVEIVEKTTGDKIDIYNLPFDDRPTFEMLSRGETEGTFQLGGSGMTRWLKELRPSTIDDIMAMVALYRPGPMDAIPEYIRRKHNPSTVTYLDPRMEEYLKASFGLLVYQDDVLLTSIKLAGYNWEEADKFRKAMGKKIPEEMAKQKQKFYDGCKNFGNLSTDIIDELWRQIEPFAAYGFNKAHAASYGIVAYQTSYMKAHYPVQYMTAVMQAEAGDAEKIAAVVFECSRLKIEVLPPDINESFRSFAMVSKHGEPGRIRFGLSAIKNLGEHISEVIYVERKKNGPYKTLEDLLERVNDKDLNKKSLEALIQTGALDGFGYDRGVLMGNIEHILGYVRRIREEGETQQFSLFSGTSISLDNKLSMKPAPDATMDQKLTWEKNLLGLYVSSHPFAPYEPMFGSALTPLSQVEAQPRDGWVIIGGVLDTVTKKITKSGKIMMFATMQDRSGTLEILVFPKTFEQTQEIWKAGAVVCVVGKTPKEEGDNKVFVEKAFVLTPESAPAVASQLAVGGNMPAPASAAAPVEARLEIEMTQEQVSMAAEKLKGTFMRNPGRTRVYIRVGSNVLRTDILVEPSERLKAEIEAVVGMESVRM